MKCIALILAILISVPPVLDAVGYIIDNENLVLDENFSEEEKEERESKDGEEKDKELNLDELGIIEDSSLNYYSMLVCFHDLMQSQHIEENTSPPPKA